MKIKVIGVGQSLRGDDAAGLEAVRMWQKEYPRTSGRPDVRVEISELPGLALLQLLEGVDAAVLVDSVKSRSKPGTIQRVNIDQLNAFASDSKSAHGWGIAETIQLDRVLHPERPPVDIRFIGIEAQQMNLGEALSPSVRQALPIASEFIEAEVNQLL